MQCLFALFGYLAGTFSGGYIIPCSIFAGPMPSVPVAGVRLNKAAAKRFVRGALWDSSSGPSEQNSDVGVSNDRKRKLDTDSNIESPQTKRTHID